MRVLGRSATCRYLLLLLPFVLLPLSAGAAILSLSWTNNLLQIRGPNIPGDYLEIWYLEAFCRSGSTHQEWNKTTISHTTELLASTPERIRLRTRLQPDVLLEHEIVAHADDVEFLVSAENRGAVFADVQWFQPCLRVDRFTGLKQNDYIQKSFIFTGKGLQRLSELPRTVEAIYRGGQVYVPASVPVADVNPRPISTVKPANGLIGCFSADEKQLLATAWDQTQELFQGVIVCLHNDPRVGGLRPGEKRALRGKVYLLPNDTQKLLARYEHDFGEPPAKSP